MEKKRERMERARERDERGTSWSQKAEVGASRKVGGREITQPHGIIEQGLGMTETWGQFYQKIPSTYTTSGCNVSSAWSCLLPPGHHMRMFSLETQANPTTAPGSCWRPLIGAWTGCPECLGRTFGVSRCGYQKTQRVELWWHASRFHAVDLSPWRF